MRDTILIAIAGLIFMLATGIAKADVEKSKVEWHELYVKAGCMEKTFLQREICKTKVFQRTNWEDGKKQLSGFFSNLDLN